MEDEKVEDDLSKELSSQDITSQEVTSDVTLNDQSPSQEVLGDGRENRPRKKKVMEVKAETQTGTLPA